ncbi:MAG: group 1 glycosyl transferase [Parcubacteria group bacterium Licking1014_17]|nr:MAG: group 1 glycosyl transferase [Parcubacteria group bacterium Licking1014_17]
MKKVLIFTTSYLPSIGGAELAVKNITDRLPDFHFDLITSRFNSRGGSYDRDLKSEERIGNTDVFRCGGRFSLTNFFVPKIFFPISAFIKSARLTQKKGPYNYIFALQASQGGGAAWLYKIFYGKQFVLNVQEGESLDKQGILKSIFRKLIIKKADKIVVISNYLKSYIAKQGISENKIFVIPNGVDIELFGKEKYAGEAESEKNLLGINKDEKVIISVSRLVPKNGVLDLIVACSLLKTKNWKLLLVGNGHLRGVAEKLASNLGLKNKVIFAGSVKHDDLPKYLAMSDIFARPSVSEGLGTAFLEAMAMEVPIVGTLVGGIPNFLKDGETGIACKPNNPESIALAIDAILADDNLRQNLASRAKKLVRNKYNWDLIADNYRKILN